MDYVNHINKFEDAQAIQAALDAGTLANPYVAMDSAGTLDFNSLQPTPPAPATMGTWTYDASLYGYKFLITDDSDQYWTTPVYIGKMNGVWVEGTQVDLDITLKKDVSESSSLWHMEYSAVGVSESPSYDFDETGVSEAWCPDVFTLDGSLDTQVCVDWNTYPNTFLFSGYPGEEYGVSITTHDPEYPEESASE